MNDWTLFFSTALAIHLIFLIAWFWAWRIENYSVVDAFWAGGIGLAGMTFAIFCEGDLLKRIAIGALAFAWSFRLTTHLRKRIYKHHPTEDARYQKLREIWKGRVERSFFWFFQGQALSVMLLALPHFLAARDLSAWGGFESIGLMIALIGLLGEKLADQQLDRFKEKDGRSSSVCRDGLWKYSRHPNYFFEMVIWIGIYLFACGSNFGWTTFHAPVIITFLLLKVTGIPPTEASAVKRKGEAYRNYQRTTSPFIPLPPKSS